MAGRLTTAVSVNQESIPLGLVTVNTGLNFTRFDQVENSVQRYSIQLQLSDFLQRIHPIYQAMLEEIRADDIACNDDSPFRQSQYRPLEDMLKNPEQLFECLGFLEREMLIELVGCSPHGKFVINSFESLSIDDSSVQLGGRGWVITEDGEASIF